MSGGKSALDALVTQAPEESASSTAPSPTSPSPNGSGGGICRCLFKPPTEKHQQQKLAAVVPGEETPVKPKQQQQTSPQPQQEQKQQAQVQPQQQQQQPRVAAASGQNQLVPPDLPPQEGINVGRKTLVLDLDETLIHSSFRVVPTAEIVITVELEGEHHKVYVRKRPGVDEFMAKVAQIYEVVVYTASMAKYANPLLDVLDPEGTVSYRLFREACTKHTKGYMKDLSKMGRDLKDTIIIDNSPICYALQPDNAIPIKTWRDDPTDRELLDLIPILGSLADVDDIPAVLQQIVWAADEDTQ